MTDDILTLKAIRRINELIWRETRTTINFDIDYENNNNILGLYTTYLGL